MPAAGNVGADSDDLLLHAKELLDIVDEELGQSIGQNTQSYLWPRCGGTVN